MRNKSGYITIKGLRRGETDKAVRFTVQEVNGVELKDEVTEWFPFSQIESSTTCVKPGELDELMVSEWILQKKELL